MIIQHEHIDLPTPNGPMRTFIFRPTAAGKYPGLILFSEIFQATGPIRRTAALLAGHGFVVAVRRFITSFCRRARCWPTIKPAQTRATS
ncbi:MAG: hypothetical protein WDM80_08015 [Limisphaerales bacterium]